jgi:hypothetical protein
MVALVPIESYAMPFLPTTREDNDSAVSDTAIQTIPTPQVY